MPLDGVFEFELGLDVRSVSIIGGLGDLDGLLECLDMAEGDLEEGKEEREVRRFGGPLPLELQVSAVLPVVPRVVGRCWMACIACFVAFVLWYMGTYGKEEDMLGNSVLLLYCQKRSGLTKAGLV